MAKMTKRTTEQDPEPKKDAFVGRELGVENRKQNEEMADSLVLGQPCQFYADGWRYGHVDQLPASDEKKYGQVRILHPTTGPIWVAGRDVRKLEV
jgi:hypothetical protein